MTVHAAQDRAIDEIAGGLLSLARFMNQVKSHESLCKQAGVDLDRGGAALLYKLYTEGENVRITELAERLGIDPPAVTRKAQQLERAGLLSRAADPADARALRLRLSAEGRRSIERLLAARVRWLEGLLGGWAADDRAEFGRLLHLFTATIAREQEAHDGD